MPCPALSRADPRTGRIRRRRESQTFESFPTRVGELDRFIVERTANRLVVWLPACVELWNGWPRRPPGVVRAGDPTLLSYSFIAIAGTAFSLAPEIRLISRNERAVDPRAIADLIRALLIIGDHG